MTQTFGVLTFRVELKSEETHPSPFARSGPGGAGQSSSVSAVTVGGGLPASGSTATVSKSTLAGQQQQVSDAGDTDANGGDLVEVEQHNLQVLDQNTFDVLATHRFAPNEFGLSVLSTRFRDDPNIYYVVGSLS